MVTCTKCGTGWTSAGLPICPVCGEKVARPDPETMVVPVAGASAPGKNGSAVLEVPPEVRKADSRVHPKIDAREAPKPECPVLSGTPEAAKPEPYLFQTLKPSAPPVVKEKPVELESAPRLNMMDPSVANLPAIGKDLPTASRPLNGPLLLGILAYVALAALPVTMAFESHRVVGILGFTLAGFFAPFAPIAWLAGLSAEKRRREQGFRPEPRVTLGKLLGQWGTLLLVAEATFGLVAIAALRLSGKFPHSFWTPSF